MTDEQHEAILNGEASAMRAALVDIDYDTLAAAYEMGESCPCRCHHPSAYLQSRRTCPVCLCGHV